MTDVVLLKKNVKQNISRKFCYLPQVIEGMQVLEKAHTTVVNSFLASDSLI